MKEKNRKYFNRFIVTLGIIGIIYGLIGSYLRIPIHNIAMTRFSFKIKDAVPFLYEITRWPLIVLAISFFALVIYLSRKNTKKYSWVFPIIGATVGSVIIFLFLGALGIGSIVISIVDDLFQLDKMESIGAMASLVFLVPAYLVLLGFIIGMFFYNRKIALILSAIFLLISTKPAINAIKEEIQNRKEFSQEQLSLENTLTIKELSKHFNLGEELIRNLIEKYKIPSAKFAYFSKREPMYFKDDIKKILEAEGLIKNEK